MNAENNDTAIKVYLRQIGRAPLLTPQQEIELARKIRNGDRKAREVMISSNLRRRDNRARLRGLRFAATGRHFRRKHRIDESS
jgi:DNA-directed RNA polymerase sigma subunit (sigma70/sigma32)